MVRSPFYPVAPSLAPLTQPATQCLSAGLLLTGLHCVVLLQLTCVQAPTSSVAPGCRQPLRGCSSKTALSMMKARSFSACVRGLAGSTQFSSSTCVIQAQQQDGYTAVLVMLWLAQPLSGCHSVAVLQHLAGATAQCCNKCRHAGAATLLATTRQPSSSSAPLKDSDSSG